MWPFPPPPSLASSPQGTIGKMEEDDLEEKDGEDGRRGKQEKKKKEIIKRSNRLKKNKQIEGGRRNIKITRKTDE